MFASYNVIDFSVTKGIFLLSVSNVCISPRSFLHLFSILTETSYTHSLVRTRTTLHNTPQFGIIGNSFLSHILTCNHAVSFSSFERGLRRKYIWYVILKLCKETLTFKDDDH